MDDAREAAAKARTERVFEAVDRLGPDRLDQFALQTPDLGVRAERLERLEAVADEAGRRELLDDARDTLQRELMERWTSHLRLAYGAESTMTGRAEDRAAAVTALRDLVAVAVMQDRLDPVDADALARGGLSLLELGSLDAFTVASAVPDGRPGAPTAADWAEAAAAEHEPPAPRRTSPVVTIAIGAVAMVVLAWLVLTQLGG
jgi:hypothetical protein